MLLNATKLDPVGFVEALPEQITLNEVQRVLRLCLQSNQLWIKLKSFVVQQLICSAILQVKDGVGLKRLTAQTGKNFKGGILLYSGTNCFSISELLYAVPIDRLWK